MKAAMIFPDSSSEKGISKYSLDLIKNIRKQGVDLDEISFIQGKFMTLFKKLSKITKYDVIHLQHEYNLLGLYGLPYFFLLSFLKSFKKKSLIITMHTVPSQKTNFEGGKIKTFLRKLLYSLQNKCINWSSNKIIVHTESFKEILINEYFFQKEKLIVLPHAIIEDIKVINKEKAKKELKLKGNVYLLIGTLVPDHGHDIILRHADEIGKTILIASNPSSVNYRNETKIKNFLELNQDIVRENNFEDFVRFDLGKIPYDKWWKYFYASDLILLPYRGGVGSGIFADAMAVKKPVIASNVIYFKDFAKKYGCLKLANEDEFSKIIKEAMKPSNYKKMVSECERYFNENSLTPISKKYKKIYKSLK